MFPDAENLWIQVALGEDSGPEFKEVRFRGRKVSAPGRDALADELAAFANAAGGRLLLGVTDDRKPQGLDPPQLDRVVSFVGEICNASIKPRLDYRVYRVPVPEGKGGALLVEVPKGIAVHRSPGGCFAHSGDTKRRMDEPEILRLSQARGLSDATSVDTQIVQGTGINTLHPDLWRRYVSSRVEEPAEAALRKLKFAKKDGSGVLRATVGGILLATGEPREWLPNAWIQAVCYRGIHTDARQQVDAHDITGPLDEQVREAARFVAKNQRIAAHKDPARLDIPQFSASAVFEALVNAVAHRDYAVGGSRIRLFLFEDRLELYSPGGLSNSMTIEDLRSSQFTRNELVASRLGQCVVGDTPGSGGRRYFIERRGEGVTVIEDETFALAGERARFELLGGRELRLTLPAAPLPVAEGIAARVIVTNESTGKPLSGIHVLMLYPNRTYLEAETDSFGRASFTLHSKLPMTIFCARDGFAAQVTHDHLPDEPLELSMRPVQDGGSRILANQSGHLAGHPEGIEGGLNPILDGLDRTYLYTDNIAINEGQAQPVHFALHEPLRLTDVRGACATVCFREMVGKSSVFDYERRER